MTEQWPGKKQFADPGPDWGVRVIEPGFPSAAGGWWDDFGAIPCCVGAWQAKAAASYAASLLDLSSNGNNLTEGAGAVPWNAANGWQFVAALSQYLSTGVTPAANWSAIVQYANNAVVGRCAIGSTAGGSTQFGLWPTWAATNVGYHNGGQISVMPQLVTGNLAVAGQQGYRNGAAEGPPIPGWAGIGSVVFIGAYSLGGFPGNFITADIYAAALYDCVLNAGEVAAVAAAMAAL